MVGFGRLADSMRDISTDFFLSFLSVLLQNLAAQLQAAHFNFLPLWMGQGSEWDFVG